ncbi:MAG: deoxyribonuclease IV [Deltaproteobacteria bacterium]|nr:deoxyribonuclease IV [Candidatus Anaeroferrophillus wilburensis]MBN2888313.1 deoxyribonuclease IV [Deltaproteobacteria bacterium]
MKWIGAHVSTAGGVQNAPRNATTIGARAFALFTKNQRRWQAKPLTDEQVALFHHYMAIGHFTPAQVLPHDSYLINLGHPGKQERQQSVEAFIDEIRRCAQLGLTSLNIHPGSSLGRISDDACLENIAAGINQALEVTNGITVVLENTAGQGNNLGHRFEHLAAIIDLIEDRARIGICLDTCHLFAAGYELRTATGFDETMAEFDHIIGFNYLRGAHLNDAKVTLGQRVDRHERLGEGTLGWQVFRRLMNDPRFDRMPLILETIDSSRWAAEIRILYDMIETTNCDSMGRF